MKEKIFRWIFKSLCALLILNIVAFIWFDNIWVIDRIGWTLFILLALSFIERCAKGKEL